MASILDHYKPEYERRVKFNKLDNGDGTIDMNPTGVTTSDLAVRMFDVTDREIWNVTIEDEVGYSAVTPFTWQESWFSREFITAHISPAYDRILFANGSAKVLIYDRQLTLEEAYKVWKFLKYDITPVATDVEGEYTTATFIDGTDIYLTDVSGNGQHLPIVAGGVVDGKLTPDTVLRMPSAYWDKSDAAIWVNANLFYYDAINTRDWRVDELHYRLIDEVFGVNPTHRTFGRQIWVDEVFTGLDRLVLYDTEQTQLATLRSFIGIKDFQSQGNYYYNNEWTIRPYLQFIVEGTTFDMGLESASSDTAFWGDGTSDAVGTVEATYAHTWSYGGKHLVSVTDNLVKFDINGRGVGGDIAYWKTALANWTNIVVFYINNNQFTGDLSGWASALANWTNIVRFYIYSNQFTGDLSGWASALANWTNIVRFYIITNQFTGDLSSWATALANWTNIEYFYIHSNQFSYIVAPEQLSGTSYSLQDNLALVDNINSLLEGQYDYYFINVPIKDLAIDISGMPVPTYDYQPLADLFTAQGFILTIITD